MWRTEGTVDGTYQITMSCVRFSIEVREGMIVKAAASHQWMVGKTLEMISQWLGNLEINGAIEKIK